MASEALFRLWCSGDREKQICPYKKFERLDMPTDAAKKRLSDVRSLMGRLEGKLRAENAWIANPSLAQVNEMFARAKDVLAVPEQTSKGRKRRVDQLSWYRHLDLLREKDKKSRNNEDNDEDDE